MTLPEGGSTRQRLMAALKDWHDGLPTVAGLCEKTGISRAALYRYHRDVLDEVRRRREGGKPVPPGGPPSWELLQDENLLLRRQLAQVAGLVDHYFRAYEEASAALAYKEAELAALKTKLKERPVSIRGEL